LPLRQILKVLDSFTDGIGLWNIDPRCSQLQMRYGAFRAMVYGHFQDLQEQQPQSWTTFIQLLREVQPHGFELYSFAELNTFDTASLIAS
jgi:hypothetical protein